MGWNATDHRHKLLGHVFTRKESLPQADIVAVDGPAQLRNFTGSHTSPPRHVAKSLYTQILTAKPRIVFIAFDHRGRMPPARHKVWEQRKPPPMAIVASDEDVEKVTVDTLGDSSWDKLWRNTNGKIKLFHLLFTSLKTHIAGGLGIDYDDSVQWIMTEPNGEQVWTFPFNAEPTVVPILVNQPYGEAEAQVVMALQHYICSAASENEPVPSSLILTIDTDIVLQMSGVWARNVQLAWAQVWQAPSGQVYRGSKSNKKFQENPLFWNTRPGKAPTFSGKRMWEIVSMDKVQAGADRELMLWRQFCWMAVGGVDYCKGVGRFGWYATATDNTKTVGWWLTRPNPFTLTENGFKLDVGALCRIMARSRKAKKAETNEKPNGGSVALVAELNDMLYCVEYYAWHDATRPHIAGPRRKDYIPIPESTSVTLWLMSPSRRSCVVDIENTYPSCTKIPSSCHVSDMASLSKYRAQ